jgi:hypothetical protein
MKADLKVCSQGLHIFLLSLLLARGSIYLCLVMFLLPSFLSLHTLGGVFFFLGEVGWPPLTLQPLTLLPPPPPPSV